MQVILCCPKCTVLILICHNNVQYDWVERVVSQYQNLLRRLFNLNKNLEERLEQFLVAMITVSQSYQNC